MTSAKIVATFSLIFSFVSSALNDDSMPGMVPSMGRITGSASIETLVRVGIEKENGLAPERRMVVLHDFTPCVDDELEVKRGQVMKFTISTNVSAYCVHVYVSFVTLV